MISGPLQAIPSSLQQLQKVKILNFSQNKITSVPPGILTGCQALHTLLLHSNPISAQVWHDVSFSVTCNNFSTMSLSVCLSSLMLSLDGVLSAFVSADCLIMLRHFHESHLPSTTGRKLHQAAFTAFAMIQESCPQALFIFDIACCAYYEQHACVPPSCPLFWHCCSLVCAHAVF